MSTPLHTPGPWRVGEGSYVVADHPVPEIRGSEEVEHYGGHLICESVSPSNARLIAAAPDLLEALKAILEADEEAEAEFQKMGIPPEEEHPITIAARAAIAKATGKEQA